MKSDGIPPQPRRSPHPSGPESQRTGPATPRDWFQPATPASAVQATPGGVVPSSEIISYREPSPDTPLGWGRAILEAQDALKAKRPNGSLEQKTARAVLRKALLSEFPELGPGRLALTVPKGKRADIAVVQLAGVGSHLTLKNYNTAFGPDWVDQHLLPEFRNIVTGLFTSEGTGGTSCASAFKTETFVFVGANDAPNMDKFLEEKVGKANSAFSGLLKRALLEAATEDPSSEKWKLMSDMLADLDRGRVPIGLGVSSYDGRVRDDACLTEAGENRAIKACLQACFEAQSAANFARAERTSQVIRFSDQHIRAALKQLPEIIQQLDGRSFLDHGVPVTVMERKSRLNLRVLELHRKNPSKLPEDILPLVNVLVDLARLPDFVFYGRDEQFRTELPNRVRLGHALLQQLEAPDSPLEQPFWSQYFSLLKTNCAGNPMAQNFRPSHGLLMQDLAEGYCQRGALSIDLRNLGLYSLQELVQGLCELVHKKTEPNVLTPIEQVFFAVARNVNDRINFRKDKLVEAFLEELRHVAKDHGLDGQIDIKSGGDEFLFVFDERLLVHLPEILAGVRAKRVSAFRACALTLRDISDDHRQRAEHWMSSVGTAEASAGVLKPFENALQELLLIAKNLDRGKTRWEAASNIDKVCESPLNRLWVQLRWKRPKHLMSPQPEDCVRLDICSHEPSGRKDWTDAELLAEIARLRRELMGAAGRKNRAEETFPLFPVQSDLEKTLPLPVQMNPQEKPGESGL